MSNKERILWLDLETTGSDSDESIIEVGAVITDQTPDLNVIDQFVSLVEPDRMNWNRMGRTLDHRDVLRMHLNSGLKQAIDRGMQAGDLPTLSEVEGALLHFLRTNAPGGEQVPLGGSGVSHFDRRFIRRDWPKFDKLLTYWAYDVGVMRRMLRLSGASVGLDAARIDSARKTHRALDDILDHIEESRTYLRWLRDIEVAA